jgi:acetyl esterase/lipase
MSSLENRLVVLYLRAIRRKYVSDEALLKSIARDRAAGPARPSDRVQRRILVQQDRVAGVEVYQLSPKRPGKTGGHVVYFHGGAYVRPITSHHWWFLQELVEKTGCSVSVPLYPLAPETTCAQTVSAMAEVYRLISAEGPVPTVMGDSAGGGLAVSLCHALREQGVNLPRSLVLICPWMDVSMTHPDIAGNERLDPMLTAAGLNAAGRFYAGEQELTHPYASPLYGTLTGLPRTLLFVGTRDILSHDGIAFAEAVREEGVEIDLQVGKDMVHVWPILPIPEARTALNQIARHLDDVAGADAGPTAF